MLEGTGIPPAPRINDARKLNTEEPNLFTTKPVGKGTGLGLAISRQIVEEKHGGKLKCFSTLGEGSEFVIELPV